MQIVGDQWTPLLEKLRDELRSPKRILLAIGETIETITVENMGRREGPDRPTPWPRLSYRYRKFLQQHYGDDRDYATLILEGDLLHSIHVQMPSEKSVSVIASAQYASLHQEGGENSAGEPVPARPYFPEYPQGGGLTKNAQKKVLQAVDEVFQKIV